MRTFKNFLIGLISVGIVLGMVGWVPQVGNAFNDRFSNRFVTNKELKDLILMLKDQIDMLNDQVETLGPPCGGGTKDKRFVVSKDGNIVCDNTTGTRWQQSPSTEIFSWSGAFEHCEDLILSGKKWRLAEIKEYISLFDYNVKDQATSLNAGPFANVQSNLYWSATANAASPVGELWRSNLLTGDVLIEVVGLGRYAWCVQVSMNAN